MKRGWEAVLGRGARIAGHIVFGLVVLFALPVWAAQALFGKILRLVRPRRFPVTQAGERSPDDDRADRIPNQRKAAEDGCQFEGGCGVICGCPVAGSQNHHNKEVS